MVDVNLIRKVAVSKSWLTKAISSAKIPGDVAQQQTRLLGSRLNMAGNLVGKSEEAIAKMPMGAKRMHAVQAADDRLGASIGEHGWQGDHTKVLEKNTKRMAADFDEVKKQGSVDTDFIRKVAAIELGKSAFESLTSSNGPDDSLEHVFLIKRAQVEDEELYKLASRLPGDPLVNYEVMGGGYKKQAFGTPMFSGAPAPDPKVQASAQAPASQAAPSGPKAPTGASGSVGAGAPSVGGTSAPSVPGATSGTSSGMG